MMLSKCNVNATVNVNVVAFPVCFQQDVSNVMLRTARYRIASMN